MKFPIAHLSGNWPRVSLDFQKLFIARYPGNPIAHFHNPTVPTYCAGMEVALQSMIDLGKLAKSMDIQVAAIACNTMHLHKDRFEAESGLEMIDMIKIFKEKVRKTLANGDHRIGIIGSIPTMNSDLYHFSESHLTNIIPNEIDQEFCQRTIVDNTKFTSNFIDKEFVDFLKRWGDEEKLDCVIMGCTDFPSLLGERENMHDLIAKECTFKIYDPMETLAEACADYMKVLPNLHC